MNRHDQAWTSVWKAGLMRASEDQLGRHSRHTLRKHPRRAAAGLARPSKCCADGQLSPGNRGDFSPITEAHQTHKCHVKLLGQVEAQMTAVTFFKSLLNAQLPCLFAYSVEAMMSLAKPQFCPHAVVHSPSINFEHLLQPSTQVHHQQGFVCVRNVRTIDARRSRSMQRK